ncbi:unnamed protein product [Amoebophrya sp. A25]|nr:unnamed protein product [Amoebophrya sp. A25]|eukprot:GSA25T00006288001.1
MNASTVSSGCFSESTKDSMLLMRACSVASVQRLWSFFIFAINVRLSPGLVVVTACSCLPLTAPGRPIASLRKVLLSFKLHSTSVPARSCWILVERVSGPWASATVNTCSNQACHSSFCVISGRTIGLGGAIVSVLGGAGGSPPPVSSPAILQTVERMRKF